jgi:hypothetical protein
VTELTDFQFVMSCLDGVVTGKIARVTRHTASNQAKTIEEWYFSSERAWYLSDGGYSRIGCTDDGHLFLASVSRDEVKVRWTKTSLVQDIERQIILWLNDMKHLCRTCGARTDSSGKALENSAELIELLERAADKLQDYRAELDSEYGDSDDNDALAMEIRRKLKGE